MKNNWKHQGENKYNDEYDKENEQEEQEYDKENKQEKAYYDENPGKNNWKHH